MAQPDRPVRRARLVTVVSTAQLTPSMIRVVFDGDDLEGFGAGEFTDHYVKLQLPPPGADYSAPFDPDQVKADRPRELWPRTRTYTVQDWDEARRRLTIDFVVHGDHGVAGPWAAAAQPGDQLQLLGPGGAYSPDPDAGRHLLVGDSSVIPAISASLRRIPAGVPAHVILEVHGPEEEQPLECSGDLRLTYLHTDGCDDEALANAVRDLDFPPGDVHAFVHGEASSVRNVRRHLLVERGVPREALSASGYWKRSRTEEGWREDKAEWNRQAERDVAALA